MIERIISWLWTLLAYISPKASESIDLGDDMDSQPYIPDSPEDVIAETPPNEDEDASNPTRAGGSPDDEDVARSIEENGGSPGGPG